MTTELWIKCVVEEKCFYDKDKITPKQNMLLSLHDVLSKPLCMFSQYNTLLH